MDNQHQKIKGYRDLTQIEIDLMNKIKAHAVATESLVAETTAHLDQQSQSAHKEFGECARIARANPARWTQIAETDFQTGFMALTRAVAQPTTF